MRYFRHLSLNSSRNAISTLQNLVRSNMLQLHGIMMSPLRSQQLRLPGSGSCHVGNKALFIPFQATKWFQLKLHVLFTEAGVVQVKHEGTLDHSDPNLVRITVRSSWLSLLWFLSFFFFFYCIAWEWAHGCETQQHRKRDHQNEEKHWDWCRCWQRLDQNEERRV